MMLVAALLAVGCEKEIPLDTEGLEPKVVVNGSVEEGIPLTVRLTYSRLIYGWHDEYEEYTFDEIDNATMGLTVNGQECGGAMTADGGNYRFGYVPQEGDRIGLRVSVPGHDELSASTVVPHKPVLGDMRLSQYNTSEERATIDVRFRLDDPAAETDYYRLRVYLHDTMYIRYVDSDGDTVTEEYAEEPTRQYFACDDAAIVSLGIDDVSIDEVPTYGTLYFTDNNINGESHDIHLSFSQWMLSCDRKMYVEVEVVSMTRDRFLYEQSVDAALNGDDLGLFEEPVPVHCNITNGIGIFAGMTTGKIKAEVQ